MILVEKDFSLSTNRFTLHDYHHTDATDGVKVHYIARMLEGTSRFVGEDFEVEVSSGEVFYIPRGCRYHSYWYGTKIVWDSFGMSYLPINQKYPLRKMRPTVEIEELFDRIIGESSGCAVIALVYSLTERVLGELMSDDGRSSGLIDTAMRLMSEMPDANIPEIARLCHVSESGLYAAFRAIGTTPVKARLSLQLERAITLLTTTELTVDAIAERCGFNSSEYFYRVLRRETGKTTRELRRMM